MKLSTSISVFSSSSMTAIDSELMSFILVVLLSYFSGMLITFFFSAFFYTSSSKPRHSIGDAFQKQKIKQTHGVFKRKECPLEKLVCVLHKNIPDFTKILSTHWTRENSSLSQFICAFITCAHMFTWNEYTLNGSFSAD